MSIGTSTLTKRIIVNTSAGSNKYWMLLPHPTIPAVYKCRNGRLGTNGQAQKDLYSYEAHNKLYTKISEGYREVNEREFERLNTQAAIVGSTNKCDTLQWVERRGDVYHAVSDEHLADPSYDPILLVHVTTRQEIDGKTEFWLLFTPEASFELQSLPWPLTLVPVTGKLAKLTARVEDAMGRLFNG